MCFQFASQKFKGTKIAKSTVMTDIDDLQICDTTKAFGIIFKLNFYFC